MSLLDRLSHQKRALQNLLLSSMTNSCLIICFWNFSESYRGSRFETYSSIILSLRENLMIITTAALLYALTSCIFERNLRLTRQCSIWFLTEPSGKVHVYLWTSLLGMRLPPITRSFAIAKSIIVPFSFCTAMPCTKECLRTIRLIICWVQM